MFNTTQCLTSGNQIIADKKDVANLLASTIEGKKIPLNLLINQ